MPSYRNCDCCGKTYKNEYGDRPELCTPCWYVPTHIPTSQKERWYGMLYKKMGKDYEKSEHKKMLLLRQTDSVICNVTR